MVNGLPVTPSGAEGGRKMNKAVAPSAATTTSVQRMMRKRASAGEEVSAICALPRCVGAL